MRYTHSINQVKCIEWGLTLNQGALMDIINQASSWADAEIVNNQVYYWMSRNKIIDEIPLAYSQADTVYRSLKILAKKGLINYVKKGKKDLISMTEKGRTWNSKSTAKSQNKLGFESELNSNSDLNPNKLGFESENNSDLNPTDKNTSIYKNTNNNFLEKKSISENFKANAEQLAKIKEYGIDSSMLIDSFISYNKTSNTKCLDWNEMFTVFLNNHIFQYRLSPITSKSFAFVKTDIIAQTEEGYHPSHELSQSTIDNPVASDNWHWKDPLPGMSIAETHKFIAANKNKGENSNKAYQRLLAEMGDLL